MKDIAIIKMIFGTGLTLGALVLFFLSFKCFYKYLVQDKRCTAKTKGIVKRYAQTPGDGIYLPKVSYTVNNKEYFVIGPRYKYFKSTTKTSASSKNEMGFYETKNHGFVVDRKANSFIAVDGNPMSNLYPRGSQIDVYYDPNNPKLSYVLRYCNLKYLFWLTFVSAIAVLIFDLITLLVL